MLHGSKEWPNPPPLENPLTGDAVQQYVADQLQEHPQLGPFILRHAVRLAGDAVEEMVHLPLTIVRQRTRADPLRVMSGVRTVPDAMIAKYRLRDALLEPICIFTNPKDTKDSAVYAPHAFSALLAALYSQAGFQLDDLPDGVARYTRAAWQILDPTSLDRVPMPNERTANNKDRFWHAFRTLLPAHLDFVPDQRQRPGAQYRPVRQRRR